MGIYDTRDQSAYITKYTMSDYKESVHLEYARNEHILQWWNLEHDLLLEEIITQKQWLWYTAFVKQEAIDVIISKTSRNKIDHWVNQDPLCSQPIEQDEWVSEFLQPESALRVQEVLNQTRKRILWNDVLWGFVLARVEQLELTKKIRNPVWKECLLCNEKFVEDSLPIPLIERLGINNLDFCSPCLRDTVLQRTGNNKESIVNIKSYLSELANTIGQVPTQNYGEGISDLRYLSKDERVALLRLMQKKPSTRRIKELFGSWLNALIQAGVLEDGTRKTSRGIQTIATDGHVCFSLGEKSIDEFLYNHKIPHEKEPKYPKRNYRADFKVGDTFIEYFGLHGNLEYDEKANIKVQICKEYSIKLIEIYPEDLISVKKLEKKLLLLL